MRLITYDIEIAKPIDKVRGGWDGAKKGLAGISSVVLFDSDTGRYHLFDGTTTEQCVEHLNRADLLIGFNCIEFDQPALEGYSGKSIQKPSFDILQSIWSALGKKEKGYGLGLVAERTLGLAKSGDGESAPRLAAQGRWAELLDYNLNDVYLTKTLYEHIVMEGFIITPSGDKLYLDSPED